MKKVINARKSVVLRWLFILYNSKFTEKLQEYYTTRKFHRPFTQIHQLFIIYSICFIIFFFVFFFLPFIYPSLFQCVCVFFSPEPFESKLETFSYWAFTTKYLCVFPKNKPILLYNCSKLSKPETLTSVQCFYLTHCLNSNFTDCFNITV